MRITKFNLIMYAILVTLFLTGCKDKKIDSSSDENLGKSIEAVKKTLSDEKRQEFEEAIQVVTMSEIGNIFEVAANPEGMQRRMKDKLDGKTADEIIAESNRIIAERQEKEIEQGLQTKLHIRYPAFISFPYLDYSKHHFEITKKCIFPY